MSAPIAGRVGLVSCSHIGLKWLLRLRESDRRTMLHLSCAPRIRTILQQVVSLEYLRLIRGSMILDNIWTRFLGGGGDLYVGTTYRRVYTVISFLL